MEDILRAAGAEEVITIQRYAHLVGGAGWPPTSGRRGRPDLPQLRRAQPVHRRRQRAADQGSRQPGADHHGPGRPCADRSPGRRGLMPGSRSDGERSGDRLGAGAAAYTVPTDQPEADGTLSVGQDDTGAGPGLRRRGRRHRLDLRRRPRPPPDQRPAGQHGAQQAGHGRGRLQRRDDPGRAQRHPARWPATRSRRSTWPCGT